MGHDAPWLTLRPRTGGSTTSLGLRHDVNSMPRLAFSMIRSMAPMKSHVVMLMRSSTVLPRKVANEYISHYRSFTRWNTESSWVGYMSVVVSSCRGGSSTTLTQQTLV